MKHSQAIRKLSALLLASGLGAPATAQVGLQAFIGRDGQRGNITCYDELSGQALSSPAELQGVRLLPLDFNGRRSSDELLTNRARFKGDLVGASRIELPGALGVLYRFDRLEPGGTHSFGYLRIDPAGAVQRLGELPGTGAGSDVDPYADRIALAPDSTAFLTSTSLAAGGDVLEIELATGAVTNRTPHIPPLLFRAQSLRMASDWMVAVSSRALLRSGRAATDLFTRVPGVSSGPHYTGELVLSPGGSYALATVGSSPSSLDAFAFGPTGLADKVTATPGALRGAGFQPEAVHGPFLAVSDDGQWCAWTEVIAAKRELFMRKNAAQAAPPETHITSDALFADTLEEIGVLGIFQPGVLLAAVGEPTLDVESGIENADFFEVQLDVAGTPSFTNLTQTSGQSAPPFTAPPQLTPATLRWLPAANAYLMYDEQSGGNGRLISMRSGVSGVQTVMNDVKAVDFIERVGSDLVVSLRLGSGNRQHQLVVLPDDLSAGPTLLHDGADDAFLQPLAALDQWIVFTEVPDLGLQRLSRVELLTGVYESFPISADNFGPDMGLTPTGELALGLELNGAPRMVLWPFGATPPLLVHTPGGYGSVLPGR